MSIELPGEEEDMDVDDVEERSDMSDEGDAEVDIGGVITSETSSSITNTGSPSTSSTPMTLSLHKHKTSPTSMATTTATISRRQLVICLPDGLIKRSLSLTTATGRKIHLISYTTKSDQKVLRTPRQDPKLHEIRIPWGLYSVSASDTSARDVAMKEVVASLPSPEAERMGKKNVAMCRNGDMGWSGGMKTRRISERHAEVTRFGSSSSNSSGGGGGNAAKTMAMAIRPKKDSALVHHPGHYRGRVQSVPEVVWYPLPDGDRERVVACLDIPAERLLMGWEEDRRQLAKFLHGMSV